MKIFSWKIMAAGMAAAIMISNAASFVKEGRNLDSLRNGVLRLHILANSDSEYDQKLKLYVRDAILESSSEIFGEYDSIEEAGEKAASNLERIEKIAEETLAENGCDAPVSAKITNMYFDERVYGDITMPAGDYTALRVEIGEAKGHNWWCVMYPPLCIPAACEETVEDNKAAEDVFFSSEQQDIIYNPEKYRVRFAVWDKIKEFLNS